DIELEHIEQGTGRLLGISQSSEYSSIKGYFNSGDVLFSKMRPYLKKYILANFEGVCSSEIWILKPMEVITSEYLFYYIQTDTFIDKANITSGTKMPRSEWGVVRNIPMLLPPLEEQQKIADFLTTIDSWIQNLKSQKEELEKYKRGIMQKIFSQKIRFKDDNGNNFPDWVNIRLEDFGTIKTSSVDKKTNLNEQPVNLLNYMDVYKRNHIFKGDIFQKVTAKNSQINTSSLKKGDVLFTPSSETPVDIGHSAVIMEDLPLTVFSYHLIRFRPQKNVILPSYTAYAFKAFVFYKKLWRLAQGATRYTLSIGAFKKVSILIPVDIAEQQKIADFLSSIDNLLESKQNQIIKAEKWKEGLMQEMFV
ncbi:MAG: restriction endonuclease subunit S, partial [Parcubacteria group bacterium]|nr:restriction endonuclease subunit S [Parcubacteria group bacterium]